MEEGRENRASQSRERLEAHSGTVLIGMLILGLGLARLHSPLLFHGLVEVFTVAVAWSIFFLAWNARRLLDNHSLLLVGIASLFAGGLDTLHMLAYKGMSVFHGPDANLPTQLWIAGRYVQSVSFLIAPLYLRRKLNPALTVAIYTAVSLLLVAAILKGTFPACYVEGTGLTPFKVISEYAVILILLAATCVLLRRRAELDAKVLTCLGGSIVLTMAAEMAFTLYVGVYDTANVAGHLLRFVAFCYLYRAIIVTGLVRPYDLLFRNLAQSEEAERRANQKLAATVSALQRSDERYRAFVTNSSEGICRMELEHHIRVSLPEEEQIRLILDHARVAECNDTYARTHGFAAAAEIIGGKLGDILRRSEPPGTELVRTFIRSGYRLIELEIREPDAAGDLRYTTGSFTGVVEDGCLVRAWGVRRDITERKRAAAERERLITELQRALVEVKALSGLLPICANCKKIRDDKGYWTQVEAYLQTRADVSFSHGICPDCVKSLYPEYYPELLTSRE